LVEALARSQDSPTETKFPGVKLEALQFLHEQRHILMHGHEPLDTDTTPTLEGEAWLMHHGYTQAEGVANLDQVPERRARRDRLSQTQRRHRRLCALHRDLSGPIGGSASASARTTRRCPNPHACCIGTISRARGALRAHAAFCDRAVSSRKGKLWDAGFRGRTPC
jgi:hypothetical protein